MARVSRNRKKQGSVFGLIIPPIFGFILLYACVGLAREKEWLAIIPGLLSLLFLSPLIFALKGLLDGERQTKNMSKTKSSVCASAPMSNNQAGNAMENAKQEAHSEVHYYENQGKRYEKEYAVKADSTLPQKEKMPTAEPEAKEAAVNYNPKLIIKRRSTGELLETDKPVTLVGSNKKADFYIDNDAIDEINAVIMYKNNTWCVGNDLSSKAVIVNGKKVQPGERRTLKRGDVLVIAGIETFDVTEL